MDGTPIYFRGNAILKAILQYLRDNGMKEASDVILTGCSGISLVYYYKGLVLITAGGLATYIHADYVRSVLPPSVKYHAIADAG